MRIAYVLYPDFTGLDLVGPYEVISRWPDADASVCTAPVSTPPPDCSKARRQRPTEVSATT
jgi:putative intracellular protease/amidase